MPRLDLELLRRGLARSRTHAAALIAEGRVALSGSTITKASTQVQGTDQLTVSSAGPEYVSRAGHKLAGALEAFDGVVVEGKRCLDAGASTGGFTDVLLRAGAATVVAVDVGHGQLVPELRQHDRVDVHEGLNVRYLRAEDIGGPVQLTVCDLSFISLTLVMAALAEVTEPGGDMVVMVKPQFEVGRSNLSHTGVVTSGRERLNAVGKVLRCVLDSGLQIENVVPSTLPGQDGNLEYFLWIKVPKVDSLPRIGTEPESAPTDPADIESAKYEAVVASWLATLKEQTTEGR
ncbi:TlyA family RNA methyltransferase [Arthrobacter sp. H14]|uniref:TlyA family RNA methyltransferase n=1 Tax=Arthrobacter sp. H14 TaxID=1312959 RepID=UPI0004B67E8F|nr:TlyA family RNA methyltransferase [Arthrobacter sp. H14]